MVISFTANSNANIESSNVYFLYEIVMIIVGIIMSKIGLSGLPNKPKDKKKKKEEEEEDENEK